MELVLQFKNNGLENYTSLLTEIGYAFEKGEVLEQDYQKALEVYKLAADLGDPMGLNNLGWMYAQGYGVEQDLAQAALHYHEAVALGEEAALEDEEKVLKQSE